MTDNESAVLLKRRDEGIAEVVLNRPDKRNAFDDVIIQQLISTLTEVNADNSVKIVILRSEGKHFSAGADLGWMRRMAENSRQENLDDSRELARLMNVLNHLAKPVIGLVQGAAFGGAVGLAACCDIVIATEKSSDQPLRGARHRRAPGPAVFHLRRSVHGKAGPGIRPCTHRL